MECCPVECSGFGGVSLPCGAPADGEQLNVESVTSSEVAARLQVRACKGCSGRCGAKADALIGDRKNFFTWENQRRTRIPRPRLGREVIFGAPAAGYEVRERESNK